MVHLLGNQHSIFDQFLMELRDEVIQKDSLRFRKNMERLGEIFAYEISKEFSFTQKEVTTPLGAAQCLALAQQPVLATILRAGLPFHQGMLNFFDQAQNAFVSAYRKHHKDNTFTINIEYLSSPDLTGRILILSDPMLATGQSMLLAYRELLQHGKPEHTHFITLLASVEGIEYLKKHISSKDTSIWVGAVDDELTAQAYIVPGLGDAGDLAFGSKQ
ncbi:MAG: uracil phosphoribosyltransferase [Bacteroidetes bacterium]|nr:uracil phosphoribosyltransferase [Bacteroidota bacterium]